MIVDYPPSFRPAWRVIGAELLALTASAALLPFGLRESDVRTQRRRDQRTIVLVHGYMANRSGLLPLGAYLRWRTGCRVIAFDYVSGRGVEAGAVALMRFLRQRVRGGRIDLVCHSMGGLVARFYLQELGGARRVDRCITLSTPHRGTYNSYWVPTKAARDLRPDSALIQRIEAGRARAAPVRFVSVVAGSDNIVVPRVFGAYETVHRIADVGHVGVLFSPTAARCVADELCQRH